MESMYKLKSVSPVEPLPMLLLGGDGPCAIGEDDGKGGKGGKDKGKWGKGSKGGGGGGGTNISLLEGWCKFKVDPAVAEQIQKVRGALHSAFQAFCQKPGTLPPTQTLQLLDQVAELLSKTGANPMEVDGAAGAGGMKRPASWELEGSKGKGSAPRLDKGKGKDFGKGKLPGASSLGASNMKGRGGGGGFPKGGGGKGGGKWGGGKW